MKQIFKYPIPHEPYFRVEMPSGAQILSCAVQEGRMVLWALVDPARPMQQRGFRLCGTGHGQEGLIGPFVGTMLLMDGALVFHLFEA